MTEEQKTLVLSYIKANIGISSTVRDDYFAAQRDALAAELSEKGVTVKDKTDSDYINAYLMLLSDIAAWRYRTRGAGGAMPEDLRYRLNCLIVEGV